MFGIVLNRCRTICWIRFLALEYVAIRSARESGDSREVVVESFAAVCINSLWLVKYFWLHGIPDAGPRLIWIS